MLLLRAGQNVAAVHVDEMIGNQEVVVKNIGPQLARVSGIAGATVLGSGEIVLIINPVQLAQRPDLPFYDPNEERMAPLAPKMSATAHVRRRRRAAARHDRRRLADGAQDHEPDVDARGLRRHHREGRHRRARAASATGCPT